MQDGHQVHHRVGPRQQPLQVGAVVHVGLHQLHLRQWHQGTAVCQAPRGHRQGQPGHGRSAGRQGPADKAGLRAGTKDIGFGPSLLGGGDLIIALDGIPVKTFDELLRYLINNKSPGDTIVLTVLRGISGWRIAEPKDIEDSGNYYLEFSYKLDVTQLPRPMQIGLQSGFALGIEQKRNLAPDFTIR